MRTSTIKGLGMDFKECERRLIEWARWVARNGAGPGRCGSAEGRYLPPRVDEDEAAAKAQVPIDTNDAEQIERLMHSTVCRAARSVLAAHYLHRSVGAAYARRQGLTLEALKVMVQRAVAHLGNRIDADDEKVHVIRRGKPIWAGVAPAKQRGYIRFQLQTTCQTLCPASAGAVVGKASKKPA